MTIPSHSLLSVQLDSFPPTKYQQPQTQQVCLNHMLMKLYGCHTYALVPSGSPESVSFGTVTLTSITVQWTEVPCSDRNGEITGYTVEYSSTTPPTTNTMSGSSSRELVVGGLLPRTSYTFTVRAERAASHSTSATAFTSTPTG